MREHLRFFDTSRFVFDFAIERQEVWPGNGETSAFKSSASRTREVERTSVTPEREQIAEMSRPTLPLPPRAACFFFSGAAARARARAPRFRLRKTFRKVRRCSATPRIPFLSCPIARVGVYGSPARAHPSPAG